jgi:APA family basic amino acid/polyamine antiporter
VVWTHEIGRIAGPAWVAFCLAFYFWYRRRAGYPLFGSIKHDWEKEQIEVLTSAEEFDLLEQYKNALKEKSKEPLNVPND